MVLEKSDQFDASRHALVQEFHDVNIDEFVLTKQMRAGPLGGGRSEDQRFDPTMIANV
jgi:hypothetical protein